MRDKPKEMNGLPAASPPEDSGTGSSPGPSTGSGLSGLWRGAAGSVSTAGASLNRALSERIFIWSVALYTCVMLTLANADTSLAQGGGGGGGEVEGALQSAVDWLSNLITILGTLGLMIAAVFWLFSGSDERKRQRATGWLATCALAIGVAFLAPELVDLIGGWTGGGQGGGA
ncbi:MAG: TrbC/VirB2 family protein [Rubrobacter sp.]|nr:TrbC/VirB2 family protein [Rubrobacter sp.]